MLNRRIAILFIVSGLISGLIGCGDDRPPQPSDTHTQADRQPSPWMSDGDRWWLALDEEFEEEALADAISAARRTADSARSRWRRQSETQRLCWAIKWAAPTLEGTIEHVWVRPVTWTEHRIEGVLLSEPGVGADGSSSGLLSGHKSGAFVSFPAEELSDWVYFIDCRVDGPREGGFTIDALIGIFGDPRRDGP